MDRSNPEAAPHGPSDGRHLRWWLALVGVVAFGVAVAAPLAGVIAGFSDVPPTHEFEAAIDDLTARGFITGYPDGEFRPDSPMTRQQFAKVLTLVLGLAVSEEDVCLFADVERGGLDTLYPDNFIAALAARGVVVGTDEGGFAPQSPVTLGQAETMLTRSAGLIRPGLPSAELPRLPGAPLDAGTPLTRAQGIYLLAEFLAHVVEPDGAEPLTDQVSGVVRLAAEDGSGPCIPGAAVRVRATGPSTLSDAQGRYTLRGLDPTQEVVITAWAAGYYIGASEPVYPGTGGVDILLRPLSETDDPTYEWLSAFGTDPEASTCERCHSAEVPGSDTPADEDVGSGPLPFDEWVADAHAGSAHNPRFLTMYAGTDVAGNQSPLTRYVWDKDYGLRPLPPDPNLPYFGPGYQLDFTETTGNCATCHVPVAALADPYGVDPTTVEGVAAEGIGCDFCHKVWDVKVDQASGLPYENAPGVLSFEMRRPSSGHQFFAGPYLDVAPGEDTYSPLQKESLYCAPCHSAKFWSTQIYDSYGEWLASPYSDPETGQTCQDCHMPSRGGTLIARAEVGGNVRDPSTVRSHLMPGAADVELLRAALGLDVDARLNDGRLEVTATVTNDKTGHHVPTDSPLRQVLLVVDASGPGGQALELLAGPVLPDWAGAGSDPAQGRYAGLPGTAYAKILREPWTGVQPSAAYWNPTVIVSDTRLAAFASDTTTYAFAAPAGTSLTVRVTLVYRRAFLELAQQKGWDIPDIVMAEQLIAIDGS